MKWQLWAPALLAVIGCSRTPMLDQSSVSSRGPSVGHIEAKPTAESQAATTEPLAAAKGAPLVDELVGRPKEFGNLAVFPILAKHQVDVGPMTSLESALAKGEAEVREVGTSSEARPHRHVLRHMTVSDEAGGPEVNTLVIENKGDLPIYVLSGTVLKGGNQDRQIGQDFIIESKQTVPVDAYCVEQGRWTDERDGRATGGKFDSTAGIVTSGVRAAAQYKKSQGDVWENVARVNTAHKKGTPSGTLLATLDDDAIEKDRARLADQVNGFLSAVSPRGSVVGLAFAVDGKVNSVRWFANHKVFELFRSTLVSSAALDALTARAERNGAPAPTGANLTPHDVVSFVDEVEKAAVAEERDTAAANQNEYKESARAYGSKTLRKGGSAKAPKPTAVSVDYVAK